MPLYFAYGSNLDVHQMLRRCRESEVVGLGCLRGFRLDFTRYSSSWGGGVADVVQEAGREVWGLLYKLTSRDLQSLDEWEGYPTVYSRFRAEIQTADRRYEGVWVYEVVEKKGFIQPARRYLDIIQDAAHHFGFPDTYRTFIASVKVGGE